MSDFRIERNEASAPFFDAARAGGLLLRRCPACGRVLAPHARRCTDSDELEWTPASGRATLVTWAVDHGSPVSPELVGDDGASVVGVVELEEGPWMNTALPGITPSALRDGMAMTVRFLELGGGEPVPVFVPADADADV